MVKILMINQLIMVAILAGLIGSVVFGINMLGFPIGYAWERFAGVFAIFIPFLLIFLGGSKEKKIHQDVVFIRLVMTLIQERLNAIALAVGVPPVVSSMVGRDQKP